MKKVKDFNKLRDVCLVRELSERMAAHHKPRFLKFLNEKSHEEIRDLSKTLDKLEEKGKKLDIMEITDEKIKSLWKLLLEDAVTFLKLNDPRERGRPRLGKCASEAERKSAKAFGVRDLFNYFEQFEKFEGLLYGAEKYYHEHVVHVLRVWLVGSLLIDDIASSGDPLVTDFQNDLDNILREYCEGNEISKKEVMDHIVSNDELQAMWCIIALTHDLGYPLQKTDTINDQTRMMLRQYGKINLQDINFDVPQEYHFMNDFILRFISSKLKYEFKCHDNSGSKNKSESARKLLDYLKKVPNKRTGKGDKKIEFSSYIQPKYYLKFSKSLMEYKHGIVSAMLVMKSLVYFLESDFDIDHQRLLDFEDARQSAIRREILRAIASHTCDEIYYIRLNTLSFLLILCDELQCWGRPTFEEMSYSGKYNKESAVLIEYSKGKVHYVLNLGGKDLKKRACTMFQRLHMIFRTALDTPLREFKECIVEIKGNSGTNYKFEFKNKEFQWKEVRNNKSTDFDIWKVG